MAQHIQIPSPLILQKLYCEEEESFEDDNGSEICVETVKKETFLPSVFIENDCFFEQDDELFVLMSKEKQTHHGYIDVNLNKPLVLARKQALGLFFKVKEHYGFNALTMVLAVNYFDRFISSLKLRQDNPWMSQLAAVACLSLAAKVEETQVPLLLDLQVCYNFVFQRACYLVMKNGFFIFFFGFSFSFFFRWKNQTMFLIQKLYKEWSF